MFVRTFHRGLSLRISLLIFLVLPLIVVLGISGYFSLQRLEIQIERRMQEDIELIARAIRGPLEHSLEHGREEDLAQTLASAFRIGRVYGVYVYDEAGKKIATSGPREPDVRRGQLALLAAEGARKGGYQEAQGAQIYSYFVPLVDSIGRSTGLLQVTREGRDFHAYIDQVRRHALALLTLLSLLLLGIVIYGHHRVIGRNLGLLVRSIGRIEGGDRSHRAALCGPREVRHLAMEMNAMLDSIERSERALEQQRHQQVLLEQRLLQSQKMAAIGQLAAGVAHELGTPLSVVSGKAQRMLRNSDLPESIARVFRETRDAVQRMEHIVRQLLDFGRGNALKPLPVSLDSIAESAAGQVHSEVQNKCIELTLDGPRPAPVLVADAVLLEQALANLVRNAVQAAPVDGRVHLTWFDDEWCIGFCVADDGPGIAQALYARVFEPFFTTKSVGEGTGLGLTMAQGAVRDHGGRLEVGRAEQGGALFTMIFEKPERTE